MTTRAHEHIVKARACLDEGHKTLAIDLVYAAGRNAYLAVFHAAQAFIVFKQGKIAKTHNGVRSEFGRLAKDEPHIARTFTVFLAQAYNLKTAADYGVGTENLLSIAETADALAIAKRFVDCIEQLVGSGES